MSGLKAAATQATSTLIGGPLGSVADVLKQTKKAITPQMPEIPKPTQMPTVDDQAVQAAKRRSLIEQFGRRGRASTILTGQSDRLGD